MTSTTAVAQRTAGRRLPATARPARRSTAIAPSTPVVPSGTAMREPGRSSAVRAMRSTRWAPPAAIPYSTAAPPGQSTPSTSATRPSTVEGPTSGPTSMFTGTAQTETSGVSRISTGVQAAWATSGTASTSAAVRPSRPPLICSSARASGGAASRIAAVARAESRKPIEAALTGSSTDHSATVRASAATGEARTPANRAASSGAAMVAARCTLGSSPTSHTYPATTPAAISRRGRRRTPASSSGPSTAARTRAMFAPLTATRCEIPARRMISSVCSPMPLVSPVVIPRTSAASSGGR